MNKLMCFFPLTRFVSSLLLVLLLIASPLMAEQHLSSAGSDNTDNTIIRNELELSGFTKVGQAKFSFMFWDIYNSYLFTKTGEYSTDNNENEIIFRIQYLRDISSDDLVDNTVEQWQHLGFQQTLFQQYVPILGDLWPDIKKGDELALQIKPNKSIFYLNNKYLGSVEDKNFGQLFIDIWLSEKTSQPELRRQLLGQN